METLKTAANRGFEIVKIPSVEERMKNKYLYAKDRITNIIDWSTFWIIDKHGRLIETNSK